MVTELGRQVQALPDEKDALDERTISLIAPRLSFVIRDSFLDLKMTPDDYLEEKFKLRDNPKTIKQKNSNEVKSKVRNFFTKRRLFQLCRPVDNDDKLRNLTSVPDEELREDFKKGIREIKKEVLQDGIKFNIFGINLTMPAWIELLEHYVKCMNENKVPVVNDIAMIVQEKINGEIKEKALEMFRSDVNKANKWPMQPEQFADVIAKAQEKAVGMFEKEARAITGHTASFENDINTEIQAFQKRNQEESKALCEKHLPDCFKDLEKKVNQGHYKNNSPSYEPDLTSAQQRYEGHQSKGPMSHECIAVYLKRIEQLENMKKEHVKLTEKKTTLAESQHQKTQKASNDRIKELEKKLQQQLKKKSNEEKNRVFQHFQQEEKIHAKQFQQYQKECPDYATTLYAAVLSMTGREIGLAAGAAIGGVVGPAGIVVGGVIGAVVGTAAGGLVGIATKPVLKRVFGWS